MEQAAASTERNKALVRGDAHAIIMGPVLSFEATIGLRILEPVEDALAAQKDSHII